MSIVFTKVSKIQNGGRDVLISLPPLVCYCLKDYYFHKILWGAISCSSAMDVIHSSHLLHLIICFELFGCSLTLCHLFYEPKRHILSLLVNVSEVTIQLTACQQSVYNTFRCCLIYLKCRCPYKPI